MALLSTKPSALNLTINGTIGDFRVSRSDASSFGINVKYILTHVTLSQKAGQTELLDMMAPVREVFDVKQLGFDEIMQRDIDDARVSLELIPYLLDTAVGGQIKLFPPIVAVALPLEPLSKAPAAKYRHVSPDEIDAPEHPGHKIRRLTAGAKGEEQFQFSQFVDPDGSLISTDGAALKLSPHNCTLAIVDGQHRAMALLALHRNLTGGWSDAKRAPYERYYKVWSDKEIRSYNLDDLQMPIIICTFPQLDDRWSGPLDVVRAARGVFLTLNKTAKKVSESRNKLLNDQDMIAECLRETLSHVKSLSIKDDTGLRDWNIELDQEGDRVKIGSDVAFSGVSHLYHVIEHLLMSSDYVHTTEARGKTGAPKKRLDSAYTRLALWDDLTLDQRNSNSRTNYSDEMADAFRKRWRELFNPVIDALFGHFYPFVAFSAATLALHEKLVGSHAPELEKMLFDGQATSRTFDEFQAGLERRVTDQEKGWTTPEIKETLSRVNGLITARGEEVSWMRERRAQTLLANLSTAATKKVFNDKSIAIPIRKAIDAIYDNVFQTVAFQTALICTYTEGVLATIGIQAGQTTELPKYLESLHSLFAPTRADDVVRLLGVFEGRLEFEPSVTLAQGGNTFRNTVLPGELQPAEWPKYRFLLLELWAPVDAALVKLVEDDRLACRKLIGQSLYARRVKSYCDEHAISPELVAIEVKNEILDRTVADLMNFLEMVHGKKVKLIEDDLGLTRAIPAIEAAQSQ